MRLRVGDIWRMGVVGVIVAGVAGAFAYAGGWLTPGALTSWRIIDRFEEVNGEHPGFRRNHAKGVGVSGYFEANGEGEALSRAAVFRRGRCEVLGRFALAGGQPYQADAVHTTRSMALVFHLADGEEWRTGMNNIPVFPVKSAQGFYDLLLASAVVKETGKADPARMGAFFAAYPESAAALKAIQAAAVSSGFADATYNSLSAFRFVNAAGGVTNVRWAMVPVQAVLPAGEAPAGEKDYLFTDLIAAIRAHPLQWKLVVTIGEPGDATDDATVAWPAERKQVEVGTLTIDHVESEETSAARDINFDPLILPAGIEGSDDPLLSARSAAYSVSLTRRDGEKKQPSAITPAETGR